LGLFAFGGSPALAHNAFDSSSPFDGETVESPPAQWSITFTKSVPLETFSGEIINGDGVRTQLTNAVHGASDNIVVATLPTALSGADISEEHDMSMDGMLSVDEIAALGQLMGEEFDQAWATAMIAHHKGAIKMAETVKDDGQSTLVQDLANLIMQAQQSEIAVLETLLD
jgi:methionine-rich copper-binding protein CopC